MYKRLLVPLDGTELSPRSMSQSIELAQQLGATITGFVAEPMAPLPTDSANVGSYTATVSAFEERGAEHASRVLRLFEAQAREAGVPFEGHSTQTQNIGQAIVDAATAHSCDMIVMVTHGRSRFAELLRGSNTKAVLARCTLPVLVLH
jgi:nucleotide-binding universal stress UspA family protein